MNLKTFADQSLFLQSAQQIIENIISQELKTVHIALSGGSTPSPLFEALSQSKEIDFSKIHFWQVDERYVPSTNSNSNYNLIYKLLIEPLKAQLGGWHYFDTSLDITSCLNQYEQELKNYVLNGFDLCLLGIGFDGHTASLFPNLSVLNESSKWVAHTTTDQFKIFDRLTITFPMIMKSKQLLVLLKGEDKQAVINELQNGNKNFTKFPAKKLLEHSNINFIYENSSN